MFWRAFALIFVPLALLAAPLWFHASPEPRVGPYSAGYAVALVCVWASVLAASIALAGIARRRESLVTPAYALFVVFTLVTTLVVAEVVLTLTLRRSDSFDRYREWGHERSVLFGFEAAPSNAWEAAGARYSTDRDGFRTHVGDSDWRSATGPRIFTLGGSSTFGFGLNDDETWPHRLEALLRSQPGRADVRVINAGNNGFNSLQIALKYYLRVAPRAPTHVIYYGGLNDAWSAALWYDAIWLDPDVLFASSLVEFWARRTVGQNLYARSLVWYVVSGALGRGDADPQPGAFHLASARKNEVRKPSTPVPPLLEELHPNHQDIILANSELFRRNVRTLVLMARADGVTPILTTFIHALPPDGGPTPEVAWHNEVLRELAASEGVLLVDLERSFRSVPDPASYFHGDLYHPASGAVEFIASEIAAALSDVDLEAESRGPAPAP